MKAVSGKELGQLLVKKDWTLRSVTGSHHIYTKAGNPARIFIPIHRNKDLKVGVIRTI